ncbi:hypothetical protein SDC9_158767 [bioreactor metagenome]|uniref:Carbohydrate-binding domain-containing protein n=1 Tax=bioreactor metagenome TaxID=1076179 RepID=A0A645FG44_9ZZZZ
MAFCDRDQEHLYTSGDLLEVFLKPASETWYWEIYANPKNARASFFFPGGGRALAGDFDRREHLMENLKVCATVDGTLNDWSDRDKGWTVEMAIPVTELTCFGAEVKAGSVWRFLIGRYNYSRWLEECEISGITRFKNDSRSFHHQPSFGFMKFLPAEAGGYSAFSTR